MDVRSYVELKSQTRRDETATRLRRVLQIALLLAERSMTRAELAETLNVSERRITDDITLLRAAVVVIEREHGAGYRATLPNPADRT